MKIMILVVGSVGDLLPVLGFGRLVKGEGQESVTIVTTANFKDDVLKAGLDYLELGAAESYERVISEAEQAIAKGGIPKISQGAQELLDAIPARYYDLVVENYEPNNTIVMASPWISFGVLKTIRDKLGCPAVNIWLNAVEFSLYQPWWSARRQSTEDAIKNLIIRPIFHKPHRHFNALRERLGLPAESNFVRSWLYSADLNICLFPDWAITWNRRNFPKTIVTNYLLYQRNGGVLPSEISEFLDHDDPPIVFSHTSWLSKVDEFYSASMSACKTLGRRGIFLSGRADLVPDEPSLITAKHADFAALLPRCAAIVHQGGAGTVANALAAGTPQLIVPKVADQTANARMVDRLSVGRVISPRDYAIKVTSELDSLLGSERIAKNCRIVSRLVGKDDADFKPAIAALASLGRRAAVGAL